MTFFEIWFFWQLWTVLVFLSIFDKFKFWRIKLQLWRKTLPEAQRTQGIDSLTWAISSAKKNAICIGSKFGQLYVVPLVLVQNLANRWRHLHYLLIWPPHSATCIGIKFGQLYVVPLELVQNFTNRWRHQHWFQIWPKFNTISIGSNFGQQVALLLLVTNFATRWCNLN